MKDKQLRERLSKVELLYAQRYVEHTINNACLSAPVYAVRVYSSVQMDWAVPVIFSKLPDFRMTLIFKCSMSGAASGEFWEPGWSGPLKKAPYVRVCKCCITARVI